MTPKGGKREGAGRKAAPEALRRTRKVTSMLTQSEYAVLESLCAEGESPGGYVRGIIVRHLARAAKTRGTNK